MFKKFHKENNLPNTSECLSDNGYVRKSPENKLSRFVGPSNIKKWRDLKVSFSAKTNVEFVTKLLEIAEEHLKRIGAHGEVNQVDSNENQKNIRNKTNAISLNKVESCNAIVSQESAVCTEINDEISKNKCDSKKSRTDESTKPLKKLKRTTDISANITNTEVVPLEKDKEKQNQIVYDSSAPNTQTKASVGSDGIKEGSVTENVDILRIKLCPHCKTHHVQNRCPIYFPHFIIYDTLDQTQWERKYKILHEIETNKIQNESDKEETSKYSFPMLSLPESLYIENTNDIHGFGIFAKGDIEPFTQFGPMIGKVVKEKDIPEYVDLKFIWEIAIDTGFMYIHTKSTVTSNWCKYLRPAPIRDEKNLSVISKDDKLYFVTTKFVKTGEELLFWQDWPKSTRKKMHKTTCGGCNIVFSHPHYYRIHCSIFHDMRYSLTIKKYHCKVCGKAVLGKGNIIKHAAELHNGQGAYQCQFCKKYFKRLNYLEMHRTYGCSANPQRTRPLCDFCGKKFCQPQKLKVHIKRMHSDMSEVLKEFQCKSCLKILGSRAALQRHAKEVHEKQADGQCFCSRCGKKFQNNSNLKIHMLTHSGIKPFKCQSCNAAFTTKQCLQFHYKKIHNFTEEDMPKIERNIDYTFQAYSGNEEIEQNDEAPTEKAHNTISINRHERDSGFDNSNENISKKERNIDCTFRAYNGNDEIEQNNEASTEKAPNTTPINKYDGESDFDNASLDSDNVDDPKPQEDSSSNHADELQSSPNNVTHTESHPNTTTHIKVQSKGSKKWIGDEPASKLSDIYSVERLSKDDLSSITLQETEIYSRSKLSNMNDFARHEASNASLLVEAALDSVCNEPNIEIVDSTTPNCTDSLVNNLYNLAQPDTLPEVSYSDNCIGDSREIDLMSPSVNDHVSVTDELNDELRQNDDMGIPYANFHQHDFSPSQSPDMHRSNFVRNYINSLSPQNLSSDDSNGMTVQNLSLNDSKNDIQLDLSLYKSYKSDSQDYMRKMRLSVDNLDQDHIDVINNDLPDMENETKELSDREDHPKYTDELANDIRSKFDMDLDMRLKGYEGIECEPLRQRNHPYESVEMDFRSKSYDLIDVENRNKQYGDIMESDFRSDRNFEPLILNTSELQGLDMSARSFHNYSNISRYHPLYPDVERVDLRLNYSPPPPAYTHADILRVVSLDLTPPGRHSVDLSLRNHPLHQIANTRLLGDHGIQSNPHRLLDQSRLLSAELAPRLISETNSRILTDHSTSRILNSELGPTHLLSSEPSRLLGEEGRLIGDTRLLGANPTGAVSPVQGFTGYSVTQNPYHPHPTALPARPHVTSPTPAPYHYPTYY